MNAIYCRQSLEKVDSLSIDSQIAFCRKFAGSDAKVYIDRGFSGKNLNRPAFSELLKEIKTGKIEKLFVYRLDRLSRSIADFSRLWELLEKYGVEFYSATEQFDTSTPVGRAMLSIVTVFAQLERETVSERVRDNYYHRAKLGAWTGGPAPFGFSLSKIINADGNRVSSLTANEQAKTVKWIFERYIEPDSSLRKIATELTKKGIHGPKREAWDSVTVSRILKSPLYVRANFEVYLHYLSQGLKIEQGSEAFDDVHGCQIIGRRNRGKDTYNDKVQQVLTLSNHEGIIDADLWLSVQDKLANNKQISRANAGKYSWLTGLMKCVGCGYALKVHCTKIDNKYKLICSGRSNFGVCDSQISVDLKELEEYIEYEITKIMDSAQSNENIMPSKKISSEILAIEQKIDRLIDALAECEGITVSYVNRQVEQFHRRREELLKSAPTVKTINSKIKFSKLAFEDKKLVAAEFIERILIKDDKVEIVWKF